MRSNRRRLTIRTQLLAVFGLLLVVSSSIVLIDEFAFRQSAQSLDTLNDEALQPLVEIKRLNDAYGLDVVDTTFRVRNNLIPWERGAEVVTQAQLDIARTWEDLSSTPMTPEEKLLLAEVERTKVAADRAAQRLLEILATQDIKALGRFADTELYPSIDPITSALKLLTEIQLLDAEQGIADQRRVLRNARLQRWLLFAIGLLVMVLLGGEALRRISAGVEGLVGMARDLERQRESARLDFRPGGELGELADAFRRLRFEVVRNERALREKSLEAEQASRAKSTFLATMSHEIRTPMIGITGMLEVISATRLDSEQTRMVAIIQHSSQALLQIIGDILDFSKIEAGRLELVPTTLSLRKLVQTTTYNFLPPASAKGLTLSATFDERLARAHRADPVRIRQILSNFLSNALKFTESGSIEVDVRLVDAGAEGQTVVLSVRDSGIGMSPAQQARLFEPFTQADETTTRRFGGTGLGLSICRRLAQLMGGEISVASELGRGTTMRLKLTLTVGDPHAIEGGESLEDPPVTLLVREAPTREQAIKEGSLLLLAEDHPINRMVVLRQLALAGFQADIAEDGLIALQRCGERRYALLLTDLHMPGLDGVGLASEVRKLEREQRRARMPIVALTATALIEERERCLEAGMDDLILKPATIPILSAKLRQWLPQLNWASWDEALKAAEAARAANGSSNEEGAVRSADSGRLPAIRQSVLFELCAGDERLARDTLKDFREGLDEDIGDLILALDQKQRAAAARAAHRIKGASRIVGAAEIADLCGRIEAEMSTEPPDWNPVESWKSSLHASLSRIDAAIDSRAA